MFPKAWISYWLGAKNAWSYTRRPYYNWAHIRWLKLSRESSTMLVLCLVETVSGDCVVLSPGDCLCQSIRLAIGRWWSPYHLPTLARNGELSIYWRCWTLRCGGWVFCLQPGYCMLLRVTVLRQILRELRKITRFHYSGCYSFATDMLNLHRWGPLAPLQWNDHQKKL